MITKTKKGELSQDMTIGPVISIIDGNTFRMRVDRIGIHNKFLYRDLEIIRISNILPRNSHSLKGSSTKQKLAEHFIGKNVCCKIQFRNEYDVLIADVDVI